MGAAILRHLAAVVGLVLLLVLELVARGVALLGGVASAWSHPPDTAKAHPLRPAMRLIGRLWDLPDRLTAPIRITAAAGERGLGQVEASLVRWLSTMRRQTLGVDTPNVS